MCDSGCTIGISRIDETAKSLAVTSGAEEGRSPLRRGIPELTLRSLSQCFRAPLAAHRYMGSSGSNPDLRTGRLSRLRRPSRACRAALERLLSVFESSTLLRSQKNLEPAHLKPYSTDYEGSILSQLGPVK